MFSIFRKIFSKSSKEKKEKVEENFVHFKPWVGECYNQATVKILVLGESHYCGKPEDDKENLTQEIINDFLNPNSEFEPYKNTYTKFTRALAGYKVPKEELKDIWDYVMFYNYVQFPISGPRQSPTNEQFTVSDKAFRQIIKQYKPDVVIVWGKRLFSYLPSSDDSILFVSAIPVTIRKYKFNKDNFVALEMTHPSSAYIWSFWHEAIEKVLKSCIS